MSDREERRFLAALLAVCACLGAAGNAGGMEMATFRKLGFETLPAGATEPVRLGGGPSPSAIPGPDEAFPGYGEAAMVLFDGVKVYGEPFGEDAPVAAVVNTGDILSIAKRRVVPGRSGTGPKVYFMAREAYGSDLPVKAGWVSGDVLCLPSRSDAGGLIEKEHWKKTLYESREFLGRVIANKTLRPKEPLSYRDTLVGMQRVWGNPAARAALKRAILDPAGPAEARAEVLGFAVWWDEVAGEHEEGLAWARELLTRREMDPAKAAFIEHWKDCLIRPNFKSPEAIFRAARVVIEDSADALSEAEFAQVLKALDEIRGSFTAGGRCKERVCQLLGSLSEEEPPIRSRERARALKLKLAEIAKASG